MAAPATRASTAASPRPAASASGVEGDPDDRPAVVEALEARVYDRVALARAVVVRPDPGAAG